MPERAEDVLDDDFLHDEVAAGDIDRLHLLEDGLPDEGLDGFPVLQHPVAYSACMVPWYTVPRAPASIASSTSSSVLRRLMKE